MSASSGPSIQTDGLVFDYDMSNTQKSFKGPPATNLIPYSQDYGSNGNFMANWTGNLFNNWINSVVTTGYQAPDDSYTANLITGYYSRWTASITASVSTTYTFSIWLKNYSLTSSIYLHVAFGLNGSLVNYNNIDTFQPTTIANWTRCSWTVTSPASGINQIQCGVEFGGSKSASAGPYAVLVWGAQLETGSYPTPYIPSLGASSSRSSTQAILDLTNKNTITLNTLTFNSNNTFSFNNSASSTFNIPDSTLIRPASVTISAWVNLSVYNPLNDFDGQFATIAWKGFDGQSGSQASYSLTLVTGAFPRLTIAPSVLISSVAIPTNVWVNIVGTYTAGGAMVLYRNGEIDTTGTGPTSISYSAQVFGIGTRTFNGAYQYPWNGSIGMVQLYDRALSAAEVRQNFNAQRTRYGI